MTHEQYIELETARLAKQAGFDWECRGLYFLADGEFKYGVQGNWNKTMLGEQVVSAPTQAVLQRWLQVEKQIIIEPVYDIHENLFFCRYLIGKSRNWQYLTKLLYGEEYLKISFNTYEDALEAGLQKCLTLIIEKQ